MAVDPHAGAVGEVAAADQAAGRAGLAGLIDQLGVDAPLHREAARRRWIRRVQPQRGQRGAAGNRDLRRHQVDAGHFFGHRVLDLQARVGLDEDKGQRGRFVVD